MRIKYQPTVPNSLDSSLIVKPKYQSSEVILTDDTGSSFDKSYTVLEDGWFYAEYKCANGNGWGMVTINNLGVGQFRANPIDAEHFVLLGQMLFAPKGSIISIAGDTGMKIKVYRYD